MKVFVLGGSGNVGRPVLRYLAGDGTVTGIAVAGRNFERASEVAADVGDLAVPVQVEGTDEAALAKAIDGYDIVINVAYDDSALPGIRACIRAGVHYCDAVSFEAAIDEAVKLAPQAEAAGVTIVLALGVHPSVTNLMGVEMARRLDDVEQLQLGDASMYDFGSASDLTPRQWRNDPRQSQAMLAPYVGGLEWVLQGVRDGGARPIRELDNGMWVDVDPVEQGVDVPLFDGGTAVLRPFLCGAPLFGALPADLGLVRPAEMLFSPFPPQLCDVLCDLSGRVLAGEIEPGAALESFSATIDDDPDRWLVLHDDAVPLVKTWARAVGSKGGRPARATCWFTEPHWEIGGWPLTSVSMVAAAKLIQRGDVSERGVFAAETAFDPIPFFDECADILGDALPGGVLVEESFEYLD